MKDELEARRTNAATSFGSSVSAAGVLFSTQEGSGRHASDQVMAKSPPASEGLRAMAPEHGMTGARHELHSHNGEAGWHQPLQGKTPSAGAQGSMSPRGNQSLHTLYAGGTTRVAAKHVLPDVHAVSVTK